MFYKNILINKNNFNFCILENFNSLDYGDIDKSWKTINDINEIPKDIPKDVAKAIVDFESHYYNFQDGNEWGKTYNLTTGEDYGLMTDGNVSNVALPTKSFNSSDILFAIHVHPLASPPSRNDIFRLINKNNLKFVGVDSYKDIFLMDINKRFKGTIDNLKISKQIELCKLGAFENLLNKKIPYFDCVKINFISNKILNKYINFYWWLK